MTTATKAPFRFKKMMDHGLALMVDRTQLQTDKERGKQLFGPPDADAFLAMANEWEAIFDSPDGTISQERLLVAPPQVGRLLDLWVKTVPI